MLTLLLYVLIVGLVAGLLFLLASAIFGRSEELGPLPEGTTVTVLPAEAISGSDVRALRFQQTVRGYKTGEVDWALTRLAARIDELEWQLAQVRTDIAAVAAPQPGAQEPAVAPPAAPQRAADPAVPHMATQTHVPARPDQWPGVPEPGEPAPPPATHQPGNAATHQPGSPATHQPGNGATAFGDRAAQLGGPGAAADRAAANGSPIDAAAAPDADDTRAAGEAPPLPRVLPGAADEGSPDGSDSEAGTR